MRKLELGAVALVAVGVALSFTVAASVFQRFDQAAAEDLRSAEMSAVSTGNDTQLVTFKDWGVTMSLPLGEGMPTVKYVSQGPDSYGLSTEDVEKAGKECSANNNAVGAVVRVPAGTDISSRSNVESSLGTIGKYSYLYETPPSACAGTSASATAYREVVTIEGDATLGDMLISR